MIFSGKESVLETIKIYASADIVLAYHGAAAANMIFAPHSATFIEVSTFSDSFDAKAWRSNMRNLQELRPDLKLLTYRIPLYHGWPEMNLTQVDVHPDADHFIKELSNVSLRPADIRNIMEIIRRTLHDEKIGRTSRRT